MTDNLRDRIAAAIDQKYTEEAIGHTYAVCLHAADAVIRELNISGLWSGNRLIGIVARWDDSRPTDTDLEAKEESIYGELGECDDD